MKREEKYQEEVNEEYEKASKILEKLKEEVKTNENVAQAHNAYIEAKQTKQKDEEAYVKKCTDLFRKIFFIKDSAVSNCKGPYSFLIFFEYSRNPYFTHLIYEDCLQIPRTDSFHCLTHLYDNFAQKENMGTIFTHASKTLNFLPHCIGVEINELKGKIQELNQGSKFLKRIKSYKAKIDKKILEYEEQISEKEYELSIVNCYKQRVKDSETAFNEFTRLANPVPDDIKKVEECKENYEKIFKETMEKTEGYKQMINLLSPGHKTEVIKKCFNDEVLESKNTEKTLN